MSVQKDEGSWQTLADWQREHMEEWTDPTPYWSASGKVTECEIDATQ